MTVVNYHVWAAAVLAWHYDAAHAGPVPPPDYCPSGVRTLETQHTRILTVTPVLVSTHCAYDMDLVIDHANTIHCTNAPTDISTMITITNAGSPIMTSLENGSPAKPTETGQTLGPSPGSIQAESSGASGQSSRINGGDNRYSMASGFVTNGLGHGNTAHHSANTGGPDVSSGSTSLETGSLHAETFMELSQAVASQTENPRSESTHSTSLDAGGSQKATSRLTNIPTETLTEELQTIALETKTPQSTSSGTGDSQKATSQLTDTPTESSSEETQTIALGNKTSQLSSETRDSQKATSQLTDTLTETSTDEPQTIASETETPQSTSSQTEPSPTQTSQISATTSPQVAQTATSGTASPSPSESLSLTLSSAPITTVTSTSISTKTSSTCSPAEPTTVCATKLPRACKDLSNLSGIKLDILQDAAECTSALGAFEKAVSQCFIIGPLDLLSPWKKVVKCLEDKIGTICLPQLPDACTSLAGLKGPLAPDAIALCTFQLGPFADGKALGCLKGGLVGEDMISCLRGSLGMGVSTCAAAGPACVSALPPDCTLLDNLSGLDVSPDGLGRCANAIGAYGGDAAKACLDPLSMVQTTLGGGVTACLLDELRDVCISALPDACIDLGGVTGGQLTAQVPQCVSALGPFHSGGVLTCVGELTSGPEFVLCLNKELFGS